MEVTPLVLNLLKCICIAFTSLWNGQVMYANIPEANALKEININEAIRFFPVYWPKAAKLISPTSVTALLLDLAIWWLTGEALWLVAAGFVVMNTLYTLLIVIPTVM